MIPAHWTPVALAADLPPGTVVGVVVDGSEVAIWRDAEGRAHAWEDRCPHRGMKLSFGFVRGDRLACIYHGWEYDGDARCRRIPAHPDLEVPASICANAYALAEAGGLLWLRAEPAPPPDLAPAAPLRSLFVDAPLGDALATLEREGLPGLGPVDAARDGPVLRLIQGGHRLLVGGHPTVPDACALHILIEHDPGPEARAALIPATAALRRALEAA
jgi:nitrite reductase/ring-hydroxylating ferredoxin subunit